MALLRAGYAAGRKWESALRTAVGADRPWRSRGDWSGARGFGGGVSRSRTDRACRARRRRGNIPWLWICSVQVGCFGWGNF